MVAVKSRPRERVRRIQVEGLRAVCAKFLADAAEYRSAVPRVSIPVKASRQTGLLLFIPLPATAGYRHHWRHQYLLRHAQTLVDSVRGWYGVPFGIAVHATMPHTDMLVQTPYRRSRRVSSICASAQRNKSSVTSLIYGLPAWRSAFSPCFSFR